MKQHSLNRREAMGVIAGSAALAALPAAAHEDHGDDLPVPFKAKGRLRQSVCKWCFPKLSLDALAAAAARFGMRGIDLLGPEDWDTVKRHGLTCPMANGPGPIHKGWNDPANHDELVKKSEIRLKEIAEAGLPSMIVFSGNRNGTSDSDGLRHCAAGLRRILPLAEQLGVTVAMELLNSKRDHKDYQCDRTAWGVALVQEIASPRFKLLYDIYHMQIMEGASLTPSSATSRTSAIFTPAASPDGTKLTAARNSTTAASARRLWKPDTPAISRRNSFLPTAIPSFPSHRPRRFAMSEPAYSRGAAATHLCPDGLAAACGTLQRAREDLSCAWPF